jgi:hypothetical protein
MRNLVDHFVVVVVVAVVDFVVVDDRWLSWGVERSVTTPTNGYLSAQHQYLHVIDCFVEIDRFATVENPLSPSLETLHVVARSLLAPHLALVATEKKKKKQLLVRA